MSTSRQELLPLGTLANLPGVAWTGPVVDPERALSKAIRSHVATYLEGCPIIFAWMGYSRDLIDDRIGVSGGDALVSDGVYYWRADAVAYIREYGIPIPEEALERMRMLEWRSPVFEPRVLGALFEQMTEMFDGSY